jgi:hypothetical protein
MMKVHYREGEGLQGQTLENDVCCHELCLEEAAFVTGDSAVQMHWIACGNGLQKQNGTTSSGCRALVSCVAGDTMLL